MPSHRRRKNQARITQLHTRIANAGHGRLHQLTTRPVDEYNTLILEDHAETRRVQNRKPACHIGNAGMGKLRDQLDYKTT